MKQSIPPHHICIAEFGARTKDCAVFKVVRVSKGVVNAKPRLFAEGVVVCVHAAEALVPHFTRETCMHVFRGTFLRARLVSRLTCILVAHFTRETCTFHPQELYRVELVFEWQRAAKDVSLKMES